MRAFTSLSHTHTLDPGVEYRYIGMLTDSIETIITYTYVFRFLLVLLLSCLLAISFRVLLLNCYFTSMYVCIGWSVGRSIAILHFCSLTISNRRTNSIRFACNFLILSRFSRVCTIFMCDSYGMNMSARACV